MGLSVSYSLPEQALAGSMPCGNTAIQRPAEWNTGKDCIFKNLCRVYMLCNLLCNLSLSLYDLSGIAWFRVNPRKPLTHAHTHTHIAHLLLQLVARNWFDVLLYIPDRSIRLYSLHWFIPAYTKIEHNLRSYPVPTESKNL